MAVGKLLGIGLAKISPKVAEFFNKFLTRLLDFLEKHFNNIIKHLGAIGGAGLGLGLVNNLVDTIVSGGVNKFSFFSRTLGLRTLFENLSSVLTPYMSGWNCTFLDAFSAFGGVTAVNTIINSCAYALVFWLSIIAFKWVLGLLPVLIRLSARFI